MSGFLPLSLFLVGLLGVQCSISSPLAAQQLRQPGLELIGEVDGKYFYVDPSNNEVDWQAAKWTCESAGLKFAAIESPAEEAFLNVTLSARFEETDVSHYWTSGRDRLSKLQYIWDSTGGELEDIGDVDFYGPLSCLSFHVPDYPELWDVLSCTDVWPTLCNS